MVTIYLHSYIKQRIWEENNQVNMLTILYRIVIIFFISLILTCSRDFSVSLSRIANQRLLKWLKNSREKHPILRLQRLWWRLGRQWTACKRSSSCASFLFRIDKNQKDQDEAFARAKELKAKNPNDPGIFMTKIVISSHQTRVDESKEVSRTNYAIQCIIDIELLTIEYSVTTTINS